MKTCHLVVVVGMGIALEACSGRACSRSRQSAAPPPPAPKPTVAAPAAPGTAASASTARSQTQLYDDIQNEGLTPERALQLFSMVVGRLPGVTVPTTGRDPGDFDGTLAVQFLYQEWTALTDEQRRAAAALITPGSTGKAGGTNAARSSLRTGLTRFPLALTLTLSGTSENTPAHDYHALAQDADATLAPFLKATPVPFVVDVNYDTPDGTEFAHTMFWFRPFDSHKDDLFADLSNKFGYKAYSDCHITVWNEMFKKLNPTSAKAVLTHEMMHCYQQRLAGTFDAYASVHWWIVEGEPTWVMAVVVPGATDILEDKWSPYVFGPKTVYKTRRYDAIGVFGHMSDIAGDDVVWPQLLPMFSAGIGGGDSGPFNLLLQGKQVPYFSNWGPSYFESGNALSVWRMNGPGTPPTSGPGPQSVSVQADQATELDPLASYQSGLFQLEGSADTIGVELLSGYGRLHDTGFGLDVALDSSGPLALCVKPGGCTCPDASPGVPFKIENAKAPLFIGANGGDTTAKIAVGGKSLDKFCKQPDPVPPVQIVGGGGGGGGGSSPPSEPDQPPSPVSGSHGGDTHITTFDGLHYDFQVVGEYTLVKSTKDDFQVQVRQVPVLGSKAASIGQAMATRLNGHRVTIAVENTAEVVRVDGKEVFGAPPASVRDALNCTTTMYGGVCRLTWPDGTTVRVAQVGRFSLDVNVQPAAARLGALAGLLGDGNHATANDLVGTAGAALGDHPSARDINHSLADAWRISVGASLFDYQPGQSSRTFTDPTFPSDSADAGHVANREAAEKACRQQGITEAHLLDDCIMDLAVTNDFAYTSKYGHTQRVMNASAALTSAAIPGVLRTLVMDGTITDKASQSRITFKANYGEILWLGAPGCSDLNGTMPVSILFHRPTLDQKEPAADDGYWDELRAGGYGRPGACQFGRVELKGSGTYAVVANPDKDRSGPYHIPIRFIRPDRTRAITYGTTVDGTIEHAAVRDAFTFTGHAGDVIRISGEGCELGSMFTVITAAEMTSMDSGPSCRPGTDYRLKVDGKYMLLLNWGTNAGPAKYRFVLQGASTK